MKKNDEKKSVSLTAKILAGTLAAILIFGSVGSALLILFA